MDADEGDRTGSETRAGPASELFTNIIAGLTVSFVAISLGAAFGILSSRGAFAGIVSAAVIASITAILGGTRIQCSGPTAPMTAVTATVVAFAHDGAAVVTSGITPDAFVNLVLIMSALLVAAMGVLRLGRFIRLVPSPVVSGFMNGIAILIWVDQIKSLFGLGGSPALAGPLGANLGLAIVCLVLVLYGPAVLNRGAQGRRRFVPVTLLTIILLTSVAAAAGLTVARVDVSGALRSVGDFVSLARANLPSGWSGQALWVATPFAFQLAVLCYLDTLLTSRIMDAISGEATRQDRELVAQGIANGSVAFLGGIPGAQATIRSVLILKEGATTRLAGVLVGVFVLVELIAFQDLISRIPHAVFTGVLIKVGYDVFDWAPVKRYARQTRDRLRARAAESPDETVSHIDFAFIAATTVATLVWNLNVAVIGGTLVYHALPTIRRFTRRDRDLTGTLARED